LELLLELAGKLSVVEASFGILSWKFLDLTLSFRDSEKLQSLRVPQIRLIPLVETFPLMVKVLLYVHLVAVVVRLLVKSLCSVRCVNNKEVSHSTCDGSVRDAGDR
jgi:hypothetical protein